MVGVVLCVILYPVAFLHDPPHQIRARSGTVSDAEERRPCAVALKQVENLGSGLGVWAVIEGQRHPRSILGLRRQSVDVWAQPASPGPHSRGAKGQVIQCQRRGEDLPSSRATRQSYRGGGMHRQGNAAQGRTLPRGLGSSRKAAGPLSLSLGGRCRNRWLRFSHGRR